MQFSQTGYSSPYFPTRQSKYISLSKIKKMELQTDLKADLHKMIEEIKDASILQAVYVILEREKQREEVGEDFYDTLHPMLQSSIDRGLAQIKSGETVPHEEVRKRYEKWLK